MSDAVSGNGKEHGLSKPIAIYYEQQHWFRPLFEQLDARGVNWVKVDARNHQYDVAAKEREYSLLFNRMSPSAWQRGIGHGIFYTLNYLSHLEEKGVRVVNGSRAFTHEISKALQCTVLEALGLQYPKAVVINHPSQALSAAEKIGYPLIIKPNIGGSGAGIKKFNSAEELRGAIEENSLSFGIDNVALVQEFFTARDGVITRVEVLGGEYLYAIQIHITGDTFDLCPADICKNTKGEELTRLACPVDAPKSGLTVEAYEPPRQVMVLFALTELRLLSGIYGGDAAQLSARTVLPRLVEMESEYGSLTRGMLAAQENLVFGRSWSSPSTKRSTRSL